MESKKINQLATNLAPVSTDLTILGDPTTGELKKITLQQIASLFGGITSIGMVVPSGFSVSPATLTASGTFTISGAGTTAQYIRGDGSLATFPALLSSDKLIQEVRNNSGATMLKGTIVYINGAVGNKATIAKALATTDALSSQTYGVVQDDIPNNSNGYVVVVGEVTGLDTSALTEGQQLYLSGTVAGYYTTTKPYAPIHLVYVAVVLRSHPTLGVLGVKIQNGYEMDELHNVSAQSPSNNDGLFYNSSTSLWSKNTIAGVLGYTPASSNIYTADGTIATALRTVTMGASHLLFSGATNSSGTFYQISSTQTSVNTTDTGDISLGVGYLLSASSASNQLVTRAFSFTAQNSLTGGGAITNFRVVDIQVVTSAGSTATDNDIIYILGNALASGTVTNQRGVLVRGMQGTNRAAFVGDAIGGSASTYLLIGTRTIPTGTWGVYQSESAFNNYFNGKIFIGTTTDSGYNLDVTGTARITSSITAGSLVKSGGTSSQFLKADGTVDSSTYSTFSLPSLTSGSVLFSDGTTISQNNASFFWDNTNNRLGLGTTTPLFTIHSTGSIRGNALFSATNLTVGATSAATTSSIVDIISTTKGVLFPRMTNAQLTAIATPATGLLAYATDATEGLYVKLSGGFQRFITSADPNFYTNNSTLTSARTVTSGGFNLTFTGSNTASAALATGISISHTLIAAANSDVLVGLDINPTFTTGAFTGVTGYGLKVRSITTDTANIITFGIPSNTSRGFVFDIASSIIKGNDLLRLDFTNNFLDFRYNPSGTATTVGRFFTTGNFALQNGGTFTDGGQRLQVTGTSSFTGTTATDGGQLGSELTTTGSGTNWTGTGFATGYTHTTGSVVALTTSLAAVSGNYYQITYTITGRTAGSVTIAYGGISISGVSSTGNSGPRATATTSLSITPTTDFDGTIVLSIKVISVGTATIVIKNSAGTITNEIRSATSNTNLFQGVDSGSYITTGINNTSYGLNALKVNTSGIRNTANGFNVLSANTTGTNNTAYGYNSMALNITGNFNTTVGAETLVNGTNNSECTAIGYRAVNKSTSYSNTGVGSLSLYETTSGNSNTALGNSTLQNNTTGSNNIAIGSVAAATISGGGTNLTIANNSIFIGAQTRALADNQTNQIVIGYSETGLGSNTTIIGNSSTTLTALRGSLISGGTSVNASAQLQVDSTTKGFLPPRMTTTQKTAIATPAAGLVVFDTTLVKLCVYSGTAWETITSI